MNHKYEERKHIFSGSFQTMQVWVKGDLQTLHDLLAYRKTSKNRDTVFAVIILEFE